MLVKFAAADVIDAKLVPAGLSGRSLRRWAHRNNFDYTPRPGYLYVRSRAISSRTNDNFDTFPPEEIKTAYRSFIGKPVFVNHHNANHRRARGVIIDAALHEDINPDGTPDTWAEVLMEVDAVRFPKLAQAILAGHIDRTSMGTDVKFSKCSFCGNTASNPLEYCQHIPRLKGKWIERRTASGTKESVLVHEICYGLGFFENSLLVEQPADPTAYFLGVEAGPGVKTASKVAMPGPLLHPDHDPKPVERNGKWAGVCNCGWYGDIRDNGPDALIDSALHAQKMADEAGYPTAIGEKPHPDQARGHHTYSSKKKADEEARKRHHRLRWGNYPHYGFCGICTGCGMHALPNVHGPAVTSNCPAYESEPNAGTGTNTTQTAASLTTTASKTALGIPLRLLLSCGHAVNYTHSSRTRVGPKVGDTWTCPQDDGDATVVEIGGPGKDYAGLGLDQWRAASLSYLSLLQIEAMPNDPATWGEFSDAGEALNGPAKPKYPDATQHPDYQKLGISADHVYDHYAQATPEEIEQGRRWYEDAHHVANALTMGNSDLGAGVLSAYSPQSNWPANLFNAARHLHTGVAPSGGVGLMNMHKKAATRIVNGEHWSQVLRKPKTYAFAHLIATGGKDPETGADLPDVVIDRHAMSVAAGHRIVKGGDEERAMGNLLDNPHYYDAIAQTYRDAAARVNAEHADDPHWKPLAPHQMQAITWLARQRMNSEGTIEHGTRGEQGRERGRETAERNVYDDWVDQSHNNWPGMLDTNMHDAPLGPYRFDRARDRLRAATINAARSRSLSYIALLEFEAYGETKAPPEVDTLRDESCPICGNEDSWDGDICQVCGYKSPPKPLQDPDLDKAKNNDLREDLGDEPDLDPNENLSWLTAPGTPVPGGSTGLSLSSV